MEKLCKCGESRPEMFTGNQSFCKDCRKLSLEELYVKYNKDHWELLNRSWRPRRQ